MLRLRGIPCRIGVGVFGGEADEEDARLRSYGSQHAHAWVEVPFQRGWLVFDPTPPAERGRRAPSAPDVGGGEVESAAPANTRDLLAGAGDLLTKQWLLALVVALLSALWPAGPRGLPEASRRRRRNRRAAFSCVYCARLPTPVTCASTARRSRLRA